MIELITVIVILAVLAATALPKFINIGSNARQAKVDAMAAQIHTIAAAVKTDCMLKVQNCTSSTQLTHNIWGKTVILVYGYPDAGDGLNNKRIDVLLNTNGWTVTLPTPFGTTHKFSLTDAPTPDDCSVTYRNAIFTSQKREFHVSTIKTGC